MIKCRKDLDGWCVSVGFLKLNILFGQHYHFETDEIHYAGMLKCGSLFWSRVLKVPQKP